MEHELQAAAVDFDLDYTLSIIFFEQVQFEG